MTYTNIFGGYNINTAFPSYVKYTVNEDLQLNWASSFVDTSPGTNNVTAQINDLDVTVADLTVTLGDATLISVGQTIQFNNVGDEDITINNFTGGFIATIPFDDNNQYILYLQDNTTQGGTWGITHLGAGTSSADASALAGFGTVALNSQINTNFPGKTIGANYQVLASDRASILVWTGGAGTITLLNPQLNGFYIAVNNEGSGVVSVTTADGTTIDGSGSFPLNPSESSSFIGVSGNWNTLGFGVESFFQVNVLSPINLSLVNPSLTLTNSQASRLVQQFTGVLANNVTIYYPAAAGQWYVWNNTTGAYSVTAQLAGPTGNPVVLPQGEKVILYSDGNSIYNTPTIATSATFPDGTVGSPGINFASDSTTGFYKPTTPPAGVVNYSAAGSLSLSFGGTAAGYGLAIRSGLSGLFYNTTNTSYVGFKAGVLAGNTLWTLPLEDATEPNQLLYSDGDENLGFTTATYPLTTVANQLLYSNAANTITGLATANNGVLLTDGGGVPSIGTATVPVGGTGLNTFTTAYGVICAGTTPTAPLQNAGAGFIGNVLVSSGAAALPLWFPISVVLPPATKAQQIAASSTAVYTNPAVQQYHPSAAKFWCVFNGTAVGTNPPLAGYNVTSVTRSGAGTYQINYTTPFTSVNYSVSGMCRLISAVQAVPSLVALNTDNCQIITSTIANPSVIGDPTIVSVQGFGLQ